MRKEQAPKEEEDMAEQCRDLRSKEGQRQLYPKCDHTQGYSREDRLMRHTAWHHQ